MTDKKTDKVAKPVTLDFNGNKVTILQPSVEMILFMALASLNDERVDTILKAFDLNMKDVNGVTFWPPEKEGHVKHAKVSQLIKENEKGS